MTFSNPYADLVRDRDLVSTFEETATTVPDKVRNWSDPQFAATYAPGKWSAHRILLHMLHVEMIDGVRLRMARTDPSYVVQSFVPEAWMKSESLASGPVAIAAWSALRAVNLALWREVRPDEWDRPFKHPASGDMTLRNLAQIWSGHDLHHLAQLRQIAERPVQIL
jgi:uncharacterized damage-inducible protein DinB